MLLLDHPVIIWTALGSLVVVVAVGLWSARRTRSAKDFFIAGQSLGLVVTALATMSAAFSGFVFIGGPGLTYQIGLASMFICIPVSFTGGLLCWVLAKRLRLLAGVREVFTIPDVMLVRYRSRWASGLAALAIVVGATGYLGAQLKALGILIEAVFGARELLGSWSLVLATAIGLLIILVYATAGGMVAGVYTDLVQGALMIGAAVAVFWFAVSACGGLESMVRTVAESKRFGPGHVDPLGSIPVFTAVGFFFVFSIGTLGQPQMLHKFFMLSDPRKLKWMPLTIGSTQTMCLLIWIGIGLAVPALVATGALEPLANPDDASPVFLLEIAPAALAGVVIAGVLSAIMSTADSFLNIASAALVRDLPKALGRTVSDELRWGRAAVVGVALVAAVLALSYGDLIALLGTFAFGTFGAALAPALAIGLNWCRVTSTAATASIATGIVVNLGLELLLRIGPADAFPFQPGVLSAAVALAASFSVLVAFSLHSPGASADLDDDVRLVMEL